MATLSSRGMMRLRRFRPLLWLMVGWSGSVVAAERDLAERLDGIDYEVSRVEHRIDSLSRDYSQRRGLIGSEEALQRFEDAVYIYLIGEYERAATSFYTLVESEALTHTALAHDSQWYLAECLFELGNFNTALDVYDAVIDVGPTHPFFNDAVVAGHYQDRFSTDGWCQCFLNPAYSLRYVMQPPQRPGRHHQLSRPLPRLFNPPLIYRFNSLQDFI